MRRLFLILLLMITGSLYGQWPYIPVNQAIGQGGAGGTSATCTLPSAVVSGQIAIVTVDWYGGGPPSFTDALSGIVLTQVFSDSATISAAVFTGTFTKSGTETITGSGPGYINIQCEVHPALWTISAVETSAHAYTGWSSPVTAPSVTTTTNGDLIVSHLGGYRNNALLTVDPSSLGTWVQVGSAGGGDSSGAAFRIAGVAGTYTGCAFTNQGDDQGEAITVAFAPLAIAITTTSMPDGVKNSVYHFGLLAVGGSGPYTWSITSGLLHTGLSLNSSTGVVSGTPTTYGTKSLTLQVTDGTHTTTQGVSFFVGNTGQSLSIVQSNVATSTGGPSIAFSSNVTSGNLLAAVGYQSMATGTNNSSYIPQCTDTLGTVFKMVNIGNYTTTSWTSLNAMHWLQEGKAPSTGADTISCGLVKVIAEVGGADYVGSEDFNITANTTNFPATVTSNSLTTTTANELLIGDCYPAETISFTVNSPFTVIQSNVAYEAASSTGSYSISCTSADTYVGAPWTMLLTGIYSAGVAGEPPNNIRHRVTIY